ncbi:MLO-like protein 3 [Dorcoceras hygrometricum]|uniref:MLO-like protein 3 n=1 Tax=Dorcoceras hygrometricum TaxID=472368 RepID=A0A2Z6ZW41_9LAMI|nr:MLO-like protein 3 [Dorcoceras hygrometricum]
MAADGGGLLNRSLEETPSWAVATVCFVFIFLGLCVEYLIHLGSHWLKKHKKASLYEATEKLKSVLMLLGFMSLLLTVTQRSISKICISNHEADMMLPCRSRSGTKTTKSFRHLWVTLNNLTAETFTSRNGRGLKEENSYTSLDHCSSKVIIAHISPAR